MEERGQVAIFIIFGVLVVGAVGFFFVLPGNDRGVVMGSEASGVDAFVRGCMDEVALDLVYNVGMRGGYYSSPGESISYGIPLYKIGDRSNVPTIENIEKEIAKGLAEKMEICVDDFSSLSGVDINAEKIKGVVEVKYEEIILGVDFPITITAGDKTELLRDFGGINIGLPVGKMHEVAEEIVENEGADEVCLTCVARLADDNEYVIDIVDYKEGEVFYVISYEELNGDVFEFAFGMKE